MPLKETQLAPGLLLAMPQLADPNFARSVVLMIEHNDEGSFGLVINQPSTMTAETLLSALEIEWKGNASELVWRGGPVMPTSGWVIHEPTSDTVHHSPEDSGTVQVTDQLSLSTSKDRLTAIATTPPKHMRLLLGYSGWGAGQLAAEMASGAWLHAEASPQLVFHTPHADIWEAALQTIGVNPQTIVHGAGVH